MPITLLQSNKWCFEKRQFVENKILFVESVDVSTVAGKRL
jgi:hypothetical protein